MEQSPREIRDAVDRGEIEPSRAALIFQGLRRQKNLRVPAGQASTQGEVMIRLKDYNWTQRAPDKFYYEKRKETERVFRHMVGTPIYAAAGAIDGAVDGLVYLASELSEDLGMATSRIPRKFKEGFDRGKM